MCNLPLRMAVQWVSKTPEEVSFLDHGPFREVLLGTMVGKMDALLGLQRYAPTEGPLVHE